MKKVTVHAPATIANLGPGFDVLGLALEAPCDTVIAEKIPEKIVEFHSDPAFPLPEDQNNVAFHVAKKVYEAIKPDAGVRITLKKNIPLSSGMGGSGASSAAAAAAVNWLFDEPFSREKLLAFASEGERLAAGSPHLDNVAPALFGGVCLISTKVIQLPVKNNFFWILVHPHCESETRAMRAVLPENIALSAYAKQSSHLAMLISGLLTGNAEWVKGGLVDDIIEPLRAKFIPGFSAVKAAAFAAGALGCSISGSGPSVFAVCENKKIAEYIEKSMQNAFSEAGVKSDVWVSQINFSGTVRM